MPHWLIKSAIHRGVSWLPNRQFWNGLFQTYVTRSTVFSAQMFEEKLEQTRHFLSALRRVRPGAEDFTALEVGTGWFPVVPTALYLCGAREVWTIDIDPLLGRQRVETALGYFAEYHRRDRLRGCLPEYRAERLENLASMLPLEPGLSAAEALEKVHVHAKVGDARQTGLADRSVDFLVSNGVLEYIPRGVLHELLFEARRVATPGAAMCHRLNLVDQFSYFDHSITAFNFLRYTARQWQWRNSPLIWQSRLRISDFRELLSEAGFEIVQEESQSGEARALAKIKLAPEFEKYRPEDLLVLHSWLTARGPGQPAPS